MSKRCDYKATSDEIDLQTSWLLRSNVIYCTILSLGTFCSTFYCFRFMKKHPIFSRSTHCLLCLALFFAILHDTTHVVLQFMAFFKSFYYSNDPCNLMFSSNGYCSNIGRILLSGLSGLIIVYSILSIDGVFATFFSDYYRRNGNTLGALLCVLTIILVCVVVQVVLPIGMVFNDHVPSCQFFPAAVAPRANTFLLSSLAILILNLIANVLLLRVNARKKSRSRYDLITQYQHTEAIMTSKSVSILVIVQIIALGCYALGSYLFRLAKASIPSNLYHNLIIWVYTISYVTFSLPVLIIVCIKYVRMSRKRSIQNSTLKKDTQQFRMDELNKIWGIK